LVLRLKFRPPPPEIGVKNYGKYKHMTSVVVVESPSKAKTINKYLGSNYKVFASYGHIRDLPPKDGSVRPDDDFSMDWEIDSKAQKHMKEITNALKMLRLSALFLTRLPKTQLLKRLITHAN
jgi:hypothetical protein